MDQSLHVEGLLLHDHGTHVRCLALMGLICSRVLIEAGGGGIGEELNSELEQPKHLELLQQESATRILFKAQLPREQVKAIAQVLDRFVCVFAFNDIDDEVK